jgi:methylglutaconyl-CoA hydratase
MSAIGYEVSGPVAWITLRRPEVHNAFNDEVISGLRDAFSRAEREPGARVVVLRAEGKSFSAGGDLSWMKRAANYSREENLADAGALAALLQQIDRCPRPVVCRVQGAALGGGVGLVSAADIAIAATGAVFGLTEVRVGLIPAVISPYVVRALGERQARALFLTGERFSASRAAELGLVHRVVGSEQLDAALEETLRALLDSAPGAQAACKELVREVVGREPEAVAEATAGFLAERRASVEGKEGISAFLEKRKPSWQAREA